MYLSSRTRDCKSKVKRHRHILLALTGSAADLDAIAWSRHIAEAAGSQHLDALLVDPDPADWVPEYPEESAREDDRAKQVRETAEDLASRFSGLPGLTLRTITGVGSPLPTILHELLDRACDLVVIGVDGESDRRLAEKLARKSPASVLSVPTDAPDQCRSILVPSDFSAPASLALEIACAFGTALHAEQVRCLHTYRIPTRATSATLDPDRLRRAYAASATDHLTAFLARGPVVTPPVEAAIREAALPSTAILEEARAQHSDLVVMATRGRSSISRALLGSNTADVVRHAPVPVLAVKAKGEGLSLLRTLLGTNDEEAPATAPA